MALDAALALAGEQCWRYGIDRKSDRSFIDAHYYSLRLVEHLRDLVNAVLSRLQWNAYLRSMPPQIVQTILESEQRYRSGLGQYLKFGCEPIYF